MAAVWKGEGKGEGRAVVIKNHIHAKHHGANE